MQQLLFGFDVEESGSGRLGGEQRETQAEGRERAARRKQAHPEPPAAEFEIHLRIHSAHYTMSRVLRFEVVVAAAGTLACAMRRVPPKAFLSWSSGKDSAFALCEARRLGLAEVVGIVTTVNEAHDRVAMHGVRSELLDRQITALNLRAIKVLIPSRCTNQVYETRMADACAAIKAAGVQHIIFGDLFLADIRAYRERTLADLGMTPIFPLWGRNTRQLAAEMIERGIVAHLVCLDPTLLSAKFAGRRFDAALLAEIPSQVDPCGENGEFHTVVTGGPMFSAPIAVSIGRTVERDGFVFTDVTPD